MSKKLLVFPLLALFILTGGGCFNKESADAIQNEDSSTSTSAEADNQNDNESWIGNLTDALTFNKSVKCVWSTETESGVTYVKDGKYYAETTIDGKKSYSIYDKEYSYIWEDGATEGAKFSIPEEELNEAASEETIEDIEELNFQFEGLDEEQIKVDMNCSPTSVSDDKFVPPSNVTFIDPMAGLLDGLNGLLKENEDGEMEFDLSQMGL